MGSELTSMFTIGDLVHAGLDIDVLRHLRHHWRLCQCCLSLFVSVVFIDRRLYQLRFHKRRPRRFHRCLYLVSS